MNEVEAFNEVEAKRNGWWSDKRLKSTRWMPWDMLAMKDVEGHERVRLAAKRAYDPHVSEWRNPTGVKSRYPNLSEVGLGSRRRELKHLSTCR